jgi:sugar/nucleoside kinase (ribokinase family)
MQACKQRKHSYTLQAKKNKPMPLLLEQMMGTPDGCFTLSDFFKTISSYGVKIIALTNGADGVYIFYKKKMFYHPSLKVKVISTLGAGDAFGSTFIAFLLRGFSIADAIRAGMINSASVLGYMNTQKGLLSFEKLALKIKKVDKKLLQEFYLA